MANPTDTVVITTTRQSISNLVHAFREDPELLDQVIDDLDQMWLIGGITKSVDEEGDVMFEGNVRCEGEEKAILAVLIEDEEDDDSIEDGSDD